MSNAALFGLVVLGMIPYSAMASLLWCLWFHKRDDVGIHKRDDVGILMTMFWPLMPAAWLLWKIGSASVDFGPLIAERIHRRRRERRLPRARVVSP